MKVTIQRSLDMRGGTVPQTDLYEISYKNVCGTVWRADFVW